MPFDRIGNTLKEGDLVEFVLPTEYHVVIGTIEHLEDVGVLSTGPQGMKLPAKIVLHIDIKCNMVDLTGSGVFKQLAAIKNPKNNEPKNNA